MDILESMLEQGPVATAVEFALWLDKHIELDPDFQLEDGDKDQISALAYELRVLMGRQEPEDTDTSGDQGDD